MKRAVNNESKVQNVVMIDNYDSFTWNIYQLLCIAGAEVLVVRNDEISLDELENLNPAKIIISPGPGHPIRDGGISNEVISRFAGRIPILGVCMGEQCIFSVFGGEVSCAGEIVHGKTSLINHDGKGIFKGLPQSVHVTRYHSLAGTHATLPNELEISSWTDTNMIMGVRHKRFTIEGIQFHPESILSEYGSLLIENFLNLQGGSWLVEKEDMRVGGIIKIDNDILQQIYQQRVLDLEKQMNLPGYRFADLQINYDLGISPPLIDFHCRLKKEQLALIAEIKRASPSKGDIAIAGNAAALALEYARSGAAAISVLTEPKWFKGSLADLRSVRSVLANMPHRPAVLRKEFIFCKYQILEARLAGADTVLLIVKMLSKDLLYKLYLYSVSLGMEPLVEVNNESELNIAINLGARIIGINNRDLSSFEVDLNTTSSLAPLVPNNIILCSLSGISSQKDIDKYVSEGISAILIGEALMRADDAKLYSNIIMNKEPKSSKRSILIKICGTRNPTSADFAIKAGADLIGIILIPGARRSVTLKTAKEIVRVVKETKTSRGFGESECLSTFFFAFNLQQFQRRAPLVVGVFQNQPLLEILNIQAELNLDVVQLHGNEPLEWTSVIPVPVIRRFAPNEAGLWTTGYHAIPLLDTGTGGTGEKLDWKALNKAGNGVLNAMLAGGLTPENVREALNMTHAAGVDVSSGIETNGYHDVDKIKAFIDAVRHYEQYK